MSDNAAQRATGTLVASGPAKLGVISYDWFRCVTCATEYPVIAGRIRCNGRVIDACPYCTAKVPPDMREVTRDEFFALLSAEKRDIMPNHQHRTYTVWLDQHSQSLWGWSTPGWANPGDRAQFAVMK